MELREKGRVDELKIKLEPWAHCPTKAHADDAGLDLYAPNDVVVPAHGSAVIDTGVHVQLPHGTAGLIVSKSGLNVKHNITSTGLIDVGYTGTIAVKLYNHGYDAYRVKAGDKISQLVILRMMPVSLQIADELEDAERGSNGFGSTGR